jgi:hypothetical protein
LGGNEMTKLDLHKRLMDLDTNLEVLLNELDEVTTPWEAERLEKLYDKFFAEYNLVKKQLEGEQ